MADTGVLRRTDPYRAALILFRDGRADTVKANSTSNDSIDRPARDESTILDMIAHNQCTYVIIIDANTSIRYAERYTYTKFRQNEIDIVKG